MNLCEAISITPSVNGGFVITCRELTKNKDSSIRNGMVVEMGDRMEEKPYVAKNVTQAMKIIKDKLEKCAKNQEDENETGAIKNAKYG